MSSSDYLFTSESVSEGHPDKVADRISDEIVDLYLGKEPEARVAAETLVTTNRIIVAGEVRGPKSITWDDVEHVAREAVKDELGENAMVDAAAVIANFQRMVRIADSTGIPLGEGLEGFSAQTREQLGFNRWSTN